MRTSLSGLILLSALGALAPLTEAHAQPVYYPPPPVYYQPQPVYVQPPPRPYYYGPRPHYVNDPFARPDIYIGVGGLGAFMLGESGPQSFITNGYGLDLMVGARFNRWFALEFNYQASFHNPEYNVFGQNVDNLTIEAFALDGKIFLSHWRVQPYVLFGGGIYVLGDSLSAMAQGPGYQLGGGIDFWAGPWWSVGVKVKYHGVELYNYDNKSDNSYISMVTGGIDLQLHF